MRSSILVSISLSFVFSIVALPRAECGDVTVEIDGAPVRMQVLGFGLTEAPKDKKPYTLELTANHFFHFVIPESANPQPFAASFGGVPAEVQNTLIEYNKRVIAPFEYGEAVSKSNSLLKAFENEGDVNKVEILNRRFPPEIQKAAVTKYTLLLLKSLSDESLKVSSQFKAIASSSPTFWPAWRACVYHRLKESTVPAAAIYLKEYHKTLVGYLDECDQIENGKNLKSDVFQELLWVFNCAEMLSGFNDLAESNLKGVNEDDESRGRLRRFQEQLQADDLQTQEDLEKQREENEAKLQERIVLAKDQWRLKDSELNQRRQVQDQLWNAALPMYNSLYSAYSRAYSTYQSARSAHTSAENEVSRAESAVDSAENELENADEADEIDRANDKLNDAQNRLNQANAALVRAAGRLGGAEAAMDSAKSKFANYEQNTMAPIARNINQILLDARAFMDNFRREYLREIKADEELKHNVDNFSGFLDMLRKYEIGQKAFNKGAREAERAERDKLLKAEAEDALELFKYRPDDELKELTAKLRA